jgi:hypothetical protein
MRKISFIALLGLLAVGLPAYAADIRHDASVAVGRNETVSENLYAAGKTVLVEGATEGDAMMAGMQVSLTGPVSQDAALAGMTVSVTGQVGGDLRIAGRDVTVSGPVNGEVIIFGSNVQVLSTASIAGDLVVYADEVTINGDVGGQASLHAKRIILNGHIAGNAELQATEAMKMGDHAAIDGRASCNGAAPAVFPAGVAKCDWKFNDGIIKPQEPQKRGGVGDWAVNFAMATAAGLVFFLISRRRQEGLAKEAGERPWRMAGLGLLVMAALPVMLVLLIVTLIGIPVAMLAVMAFTLFALVAWALSGAVAASLISRFVPRLARRPFDWLTVIGGTLVLHLVQAVPVLGWLVAAFVFLAAQGMLYAAVWRSFRAWRVRR